MNESTQKYLQFLTNIDKYTSAIQLTEKDREEFLRIVTPARRIIVVGTGTSLPSAQYLSSKLRANFPTKPVYFLSTAKAIREMETLASDDVVVAISYGLNRADSLIILNKASRVCQTIAISGNPSIQLKNNLNICIPPEEERIFCRPVSPLTTLLAIEYLCGVIQSPNMVIDDLGIAKDLDEWLDPTKQTIVLYAADVSYAAELLGITLREGAGMNVSVKDMENYSHGYYGPDTAVLGERQYLIVKSDSAEDTRDYDRAKNLYSLKGFRKYVITAPGDTFYANARLFREIPEIIYRSLVRTGYEMFGPNGMDENRRYHEYRHFENY